MSNGLVVTNSSECANDVSSRDATQAAKCTPSANPLPRNIPHVLQSHNFLRSSIESHFPYSHHAIGIKNIVVRLSRQQARITGGVSLNSFCNNTPANEIPIVASTITAHTHHGARLEADASSCPIAPCSRAQSSSVPLVARPAQEMFVAKSRARTVAFSARSSQADELFDVSRFMSARATEKASAQIHRERERRRRQTAGARLRNASSRAIDATRGCADDVNAPTRDLTWMLPDGGPQKGPRARL